MKQEQPVTREHAHAVRDEVQRMVDSGVDEATLNLLGMEMSYTRDPAGGYRVHTADNRMAGHLYPASALKPSNYPDGVPFIPDENVALTETASSESVSLSWWAPKDPDGLFEELERMCIDDGWTLMDKLDAPEVHARQRHYTTHGLSRHIIVSSGIVGFIQRPDR